jgi:hypothetical protein
MLNRRRFIIAAGMGFTATTARGLLAESLSEKDLTTPATRRAVEKGLDYLAKRKSSDGSFGPGGYGKNVGVVGIIATAFLSHGDMPGRGRRGEVVSDCLKYVLSHAKENGLINAADFAGYGPMYGHGFATLFLAEAFGMADSRGLRGVLSRAVKLLVDCQNEEGGWRYQPERIESDISVTICQMMALRAARNAGFEVPSGTIDRGLAYIRRCQNGDGGFIYQLTTSGESEFPRSAGAAAALYGAGLNEGPEIDGALAYLRKSLEGPAKNPATGHFWYGQYYAAQAWRRAGGEDWPKWYATIRDVILPLQQSDGSWSDDIGSEYATAMACHFLQMPASYLPLFQR